MPLLIPRIFHQVWLGPNPLPERFAAYQATWKEHHPSWLLRVWTEESLPPDLRRREVYDRLRTPAERSDLLRLEVLWRHGGVYVDTDFECRRPLDDLLDGVELFAAALDGGRLNNAILGAVAGHRLIDRALEEAEPREFHGYDKAAAGPVFVDRLLAGQPGVTIFPSELFYPASEEERAGAYAIHHAERSWQDRDELRHTLDKALARLEKSERRRQQVEAELATLRGRLERAPLRRAVRALRRLLADNVPPR